MSRQMNAKQYAMHEEMKQMDQTFFSRIDYDKMEKLPVYKWPNVKYIIKSQLDKSFWTEEEIQQYLKDNPQYEINQRFGATKMINVQFYERAWAFTELNPYGYRIPIRWLTPEEVEEYLKDPKATI